MLNNLNILNNLNNMNILNNLYNLNNMNKNEECASVDDSDSECEEFNDSDYDMDEDDILFDKNVDKDAEFVGVNEKNNGKSIENEFLSEGIFEEEHDLESGDSDSFESVRGSDEEDNVVKFPKHNPKTDKNPELKLGMIFSTKSEAKDVIQGFCYRRGMVVRFDRNDKRRLRARCTTEGCGWYIFVSPMQNDSSWQVKCYEKNHKGCSWNYNNPSIKSGWIGKNFMKKFKKYPKLGVNEFRAPLPPIYENRPGRPKKLRRRQPDEPPAPSSESRLKKVQNSVTCGKCGKIGHNSRTCKNHQSESRTPVATSMGSTQSQSQSKSHTQSKSQSQSQSKLQSQSQPSSIQKRSKLPVKRKKETATVGGVNLSGGTNRVMQSSSGTGQVIVKGGVNYITLSNLRAAAAQGTSRQDGGQKSI
ncbi:Unknown protein [Striga hermonthica]|uniref:CCHC-type domain-containing protein n=1 Tax=Striga hermonthica TaxID=68872 RepID=A0A9N7RG95_STRHE|nr:Unknown protein [Striga hermonthica]